MKTRVLAPAVGLVLAVLAAGCGGGSDDPPQDNGNNPPTNVPPPGPVTPTSANSVDRVTASMTGSHEATTPALTSGSLFASAPLVERRAAPAGAVALGGWGQVMVAAGHAATNTRVQLRNFETFVYSGGRWSRVQLGHRVAGAGFPANYAGAATEAGDLRAEASGGVSAKPAAGTIFRFWPESGVTRSLLPGSLTDVGAVFTTVQARLIKDDGAGADDTGSARYVVNTGADWWSAVRAAAPYALGAGYRAGITDGTASRLGAGKLGLVSTFWQAMNFHSANEAQVAALGSAAGGDNAPLTNSAPFEPRAVTRIVPVGDSITQGDAGGQDSYRRALWNRLVGDGTLPIVDFVGTRNGTQSTGGTCVNLAAAGGGYELPEFDTDHQAYWGTCTDVVAGLLPAALSSLAASGRAPDMALVHLGTNDLGNGDLPATVAGELQSVADALHAANGAMTVLMAEIIPRSGNEAAIGTLNDLIPGLSDIVAVDQNTGFSISLTYDGIHPGNSGENLIAARWLDAIKARLPRLP